jgi:hypothetical protein
MKAPAVNPIEENEFLQMIVDSVDDYWQLMRVKPANNKDICMSRTLLIDDGRENIFCAEQINCHSHLVKRPRDGMTLNDWLDAINAVLRNDMMSRSSATAPRDSSDDTTALEKSPLLVL